MGWRLLLVLMAAATNISLGQISPSGFTVHENFVTPELGSSPSTTNEPESMAASAATSTVSTSIAKDGATTRDSGTTKGAQQDVSTTDQLITTVESERSTLSYTRNPEVSTTGYSTMTGDASTVTSNTRHSSASTNAEVTVISEAPTSVEFPSSTTVGCVSPPTPLTTSTPQTTTPTENLTYCGNISDILLLLFLLSI